MWHGVDGRYQTILLEGPLGVEENHAFSGQAISVVQLIVPAKKKNAMKTPVHYTQTFLALKMKSFS